MFYLLERPDGHFATETIAFFVKYCLVYSLFLSYNSLLPYYHTAKVLLNMQSSHRQNGHRKTVNSLNSSKLNKKYMDKHPSFFPSRVLTNASVINRR